MSSTNSHSKQVLVCLSRLGKASVAEVQSLRLTSNFYLLFPPFVSDSKRSFQQGNPSLPWTPSRSHKYCSRSLHLQCFPVPKTDTSNNTHVHTLTSYLTHSTPQNLLSKHVWLWHRDLSQCDDPFSVSDYIHWSELYQVCRLAFVQATRK